jgi:hypothetical protein
MSHNKDRPVEKIEGHTAGKVYSLDEIAVEFRISRAHAYKMLNRVMFKCRRVLKNNGITESDDIL